MDENCDALLAANAADFVFEQKDAQRAAEGTSPRPHSWYTLTAIKLSSQPAKIRLFSRIFGSANSWYLLVRTSALSL